MQVKKYNIATSEVYTAKGGQEKKKWHRVGEMTEFMKDDGSVSRIVEIPAIGLKASVFERDDNQLAKPKQEKIVDPYGGHDIDPENISF